MPKKKSKSAAAKYAQLSRDKKPRRRAAAQLPSAGGAVAPSPGAAQPDAATPARQLAPSPRRTTARATAVSPESLVHVEHVTSDIRRILLTAGPLVLLMVAFSFFVG